MVRILYISGPMTGIPLYWTAFCHAQFLLEGHGITCLNPTSHPAGLSYEQYLDIDMAMIRASMGVVVLPGWEDSKGACAEVAYAKALGKPVRTIEEVLNELKNKEN
jgi:hypothetical protein